MPRTRRASACLAAEPAPIGEVNTTPLIDVMLVLLILCVISVPVMNHSIPIRLPGPTPTLDRTEPQVHRLAMDSAGRMRWNGLPIASGDLPSRLEIFRREPGSVLQISTSGEARYEAFDRMLGTVKRAGIERLDFIGNASFAEGLDR